jgi:uncharacterized protein YqeY
MSIKDQLTADLKDAVKSGDNMRKTVIRGTMAAMKDAEQRKREDLVKKALKQHGVERPVQSRDDTDESFAEKVAAYDKAIQEALAAEKVEENSVLTDAEQMATIQKLVKQREDTIADAQQAKRDDIAEAEQAEMKLLQTYLPKQLSREEIEAEAKAVIAEVGASEPRDMGKVMGPLMQRLQGRADGKLVGEVVRGLLAG